MLTQMSSDLRSVFGDGILGDLSKATGWGWLRISNREHWAGDTACSWILEGMWETMENPCGKVHRSWCFLFARDMGKPWRHAYLFFNVDPKNCYETWPPKGTLWPWKACGEKEKVSTMRWSQLVRSSYFSTHPRIKFVRSRYLQHQLYSWESRACFPNTKCLQ